MTKLISLLSGTAWLLLLLCGWGLPTAQAQVPVSTGKVIEVAHKTGVLTILSDQLRRPLTFYGADKPVLFTADGRATKLSEITPGMYITAQLAQIKGQWYVSKIIVSEAAAGTLKPGPVRNPPMRNRGRTEPVRFGGGTG